MVITKENFEELVLNGERTVLLDFWAEWCGPCRMMSPVIDEIADERPDILVGKVNVDNDPELANRFGIVSIPTFIVLKNGTPVAQTIGVKPKDSILDLLD
ncbi:MAG: thioredoxin [Clostridia bacterium]|nr:thioredoxin [Clostridia bacterium]MBQ5743205.1 thioredoxin [Clostridia bacterium]